MLFGLKEKDKEYEKIKILVKNGQTENIRKHAESKGLNLNSYIKKLIQEDMNESEIEEIPIEKILIEEIELPQMTEYKIKNMGLKNIEDIKKLINAFGEERAKEMLRFKQEEYNELIQKIEDFK